MADVNGDSVRYTVKELLAEINTKLDNLDTKLDAKADLVTLELLGKRIDKLESWRDRFSGVMALVLLVLFPLAALVIQHYLP